MLQRVFVEFGPHEAAFGGGLQALAFEGLAATQAGHAGGVGHIEAGALEQALDHQRQRFYRPVAALRAHMACRATGKVDQALSPLRRGGLGYEVHRPRQGR